MNKVFHTFQAQFVDNSLKDYFLRSHRVYYSKLHPNT